MEVNKLTEVLIMENASAPAEGSHNEIDPSTGAYVALSMDVDWMFPGVKIIFQRAEHIYSTMQVW